MKTRLVRCAILVLVLFAGCLVVLKLLETKIVYPAPRGGHAVATEFGAEDVSFESTDKTRLHGWYFERPRSRHTVLFFHGNGESIEGNGPWAGEIARRLNANLFIFDYRGYGKSQGKPSEPGLVADGTAAADWLSQRTGKARGELVFLGRSLGGGVAIQVAKGGTPKALILASTFSSLTDVAQSAFWWLPVRWLMRNRYESARTIATLDVPLMQLHGALDRMIPLEMARKLHDASPSSSTQFIVDQRHGHNDLPLESFASEITGFLELLDR